MATRATSDPHNLLRFVAKHGTYFANAMAELRAGHKSSCWSWYLLPTPPFIKDGEEVGSSTNRTYALRTDAEAKAYLAFKHPTVSLRTNYLEMMQLVASKLEEGVNPTRLMGIDVPRLKASAAYLERIARQDDPEVSSACAEVMERLGMPRPAAAPPPAAGQCGMIGTARGCRSYNTDHIDETNLEADVAALLDDPLFESAGTGDYLDQPVAATTIAGESMELEALFPRVPTSVAAVREYNSEDYTRAGYQRMTRMGHVDSMNAVWTHPTSGAAIFVGGRAAAEGPAASLLSKGITHIVNCTATSTTIARASPPSHTSAGTSSSGNSRATRCVWSRRHSPSSSASWLASSTLSNVLSPAAAPSSCTAPLACTARAPPAFCCACSSRASARSWPPSGHRRRAR